MAILNKDMKFKEELTKFMEAEDKDKAITILNDALEAKMQKIKEDALEYQQTQDKSILADRGYRQLTAAEEKWYKGFIEASRSPRPEQSFADFIKSPEGIMPETVITDVYKDLLEEHPLLTKINFVNAKYMTKWILNDHTIDTAVWGKLNTKITKELTSAFKEVDITQNKLSAFASVPNDMLDLGPTFIDAYVRTIMKDAIACGLEKAIVSGNGLDCPVGLDRDIHNGVSFSTSTGYPQKTAIKVTDFSPKTYGDLISKMAKTEEYTDSNSKKHGGRTRKFGSVLMIVNQVDYLTKVMPATTLLNTNGAYVKDVFPFPTEVVISNEVATGKAILCLPNEYFMAMGGAKEGVIEYSKDFQFLDDATTYKIKTYGNGKCTDNTCSLLLDISELEEAVVYTKVKGTVSTNGQA